MAAMSGVKVDSRPGDDVIDSVGELHATSLAPGQNGSI